MHTEHRDQASFCPFALREVSVLAELALGHLRYSLTDVPPQSTPRLAVSSNRITREYILAINPCEYHTTLTRLALEHRDSWDYKSSAHALRLTE